MRFLNLIPVALIVVGCDWNGSTNPLTIADVKEPSLRQARGPFYVSPKYGCMVCPPPTIETAKVLEWVDIRVEEWIRDKALWGCDGYSDEYLASAARSLPIIVYDGLTVPGGGDYAVSGWHFPDVRIEVASSNGLLRNVSTIDELPSLTHELTHVVLGDFH